MNPACHPDWRDQWLSLHDLARLMGKSYQTVYRFATEGTAGISVLRRGGRVWIRVSPTVYDTLIQR